MPNMIFVPKLRQCEALPATRNWSLLSLVLTIASPHVRRRDCSLASYWFGVPRASRGQPYLLECPPMPQENEERAMPEAPC
jgi:hypothetical protein